MSTDRRAIEFVEPDGSRAVRDVAIDRWIDAEGVGRWRFRLIYQLAEYPAIDLVRLDADRPAPPPRPGMIATYELRQFRYPSGGGWFEYHRK